MNQTSVLYAVKCLVLKISIWIKDLNVRPDTIILLKNIGRILFHINCSKIFYDPSSRVINKINKNQNKQMGPN